MRRRAPAIASTLAEAIARDGGTATRHRLHERWSANMHGTLPLVVALRQPSTSGWTAWLLRCFARISERRLLRELSADQLKDIGLSHADVARECRRWPWDGRE
jgi:uncharacterized protein YjiS (DUF1127 family)